MTAPVTLTLSAEDATSVMQALRNEARRSKSRFGVRATHLERVYLQIERARAEAGER